MRHSIFNSASGFPRGAPDLPTLLYSLFQYESLLRLLNHIVYNGSCVAVHLRKSKSKRDPYHVGTCFETAVLTLVNRSFPQYTLHYSVLFSLWIVLTAAGKLSASSPCVDAKTSQKTCISFLLISVVLTRRIYFIKQFRPEVIRWKKNSNKLHTAAHPPDSAT